jgi:GNAT superfamily N-acetyltransferase
MPTATITIARATLSDLDALARLFDAYRIFYGQSSDRTAAHSFLRDRLQRDESVIFLARDAASRGLGFTQLFPSFSSVAARPLWILNDLYVSEAARRHGVARALMERARRHAVETGAVRLVLATARDNHAAQALYGSLGYRRDESMFDYALEVG